MNAELSLENGVTLEFEVLAVGAVCTLKHTLSSVCLILFCINNFPETVESIFKCSGLFITLELNIGRPGFVKVVR